jgi:hypothetical protein
MLIHVFFLLIIAVNTRIFVKSFTRQFRRYNVSLLKFDGQELLLSFDPAIMDFSDAISQFCMQFDCSEPTQWVAKVQHDYEIHIDRMLHKSLSTIQSEYNWLELSDIKVTADINNQKIAKFNWKTLLKSKHLSTLAVGDVLAILKVNIIPNNSPLDLFELSTFLFNSEKYDLAILACSPYIAQLLDHNWQDANLDVVMAVLNLMAEAYRMTGQLDMAVYYYAKVIILHGKQPTYPQSLSHVHRLRMLLAVPSLPPSLATARAHREVMVADLKSFTAHIRAKQYTVSMQVCAFINTLWCTFG